MIQGIVIDEFADRRDKAEHMKMLRQGYDQVSGVSEAKYENCGIDFKTFMKQFRGQERNGFRFGVPVNYMYMFIYLREKSADDYTGLEAYVEEKRKHGDATFFPLVAPDKIVDENNDLSEEDVFLSQVRAVNNGQLTASLTAAEGMSSQDRNSVDAPLAEDQATSQLTWRRQVASTLVNLQEGIDTSMDQHAQTAAKMERVEAAVRSISESIQQLTTLQARSWRVQEIQASRIHKMQCGRCASIYDEFANGSFNELSDAWVCPGCGGAVQQYIATTLDQAVTRLDRTQTSLSPQQQLVSPRAVSFADAQLPSVSTASSLAQPVRGTPGRRHTTSTRQALHNDDPLETLLPLSAAPPEVAPLPPMLGAQQVPAPQTQTAGAVEFQLASRSSTVMTKPKHLPPIPGTS